MGALRGNSTKRPRGTVHLKAPSSLERLRENVLVASQDLKRLRQDNAILKTQIQELTSDLQQRPKHAGLQFPDEPAMMRRKIEGFIKSIDNYLEEGLKQEQT